MHSLLLLVLFLPPSENEFENGKNSTSSIQQCQWKWSEISERLMWASSLSILFHSLLFLFLHHSASNYAFSFPRFHFLTPHWFGEIRRNERKSQVILRYIFPLSSSNYMGFPSLSDYFHHCRHFASLPSTFLISCSLRHYQWRAKKVGSSTKSRWSRRWEGDRECSIRVEWVYEVCLEGYRIEKWRACESLMKKWDTYRRGIYR